MFALMVSPPLTPFNTVHTFSPLPKTCRGTVNVVLPPGLMAVTVKFVRGKGALPTGGEQVITPVVASKVTPGGRVEGEIVQEETVPVIVGLITVVFPGMSFD